MADQKLTALTVLDPVALTDIVYVAAAPGGSPLPRRASIQVVLAGGGLLPGYGGEMTISGGSITPTHLYHTVDTEADAATDDLDTIVATNAKAGDKLILRAINGSRDITYTDGTGAGKMALAGSASFVPLTNRATIEFVYDSVTTEWHEISRSDN